MKNWAGTVLLLADRRQSDTAKALRAAGYRLLTTYSPDHAVAICVGNPVDAVVLDQEHFIVTENWSVAQSLKMIKTNLCVILVVHGTLLDGHVPHGVDAIVSNDDAKALIKTMKRVLN